MSSMCGCCAPNRAKGARPFEPRWQRCTRQTTRKGCPLCNIAWNIATCIVPDHPTFRAPRGMHPDHGRNTQHSFAGCRGAALGPGDERAFERWSGERQSVSAIMQNKKGVAPTLMWLHVHCSPARHAPTDVRRYPHFLVGAQGATPDKEQESNRTTSS
ncbi:MAG: hypothetical protein AAGF95_30495 [Chloroflexota bacterium]